MNNHNHVRTQIMLGLLILAVLLTSLSFIKVNNRIADLEVVQAEALALMEKMVETDEALMRASENLNTQSMANSDAISSNTDVGFALFELVNALSDKLTRDVAEIYQGHIIPIRAVLMNSNLK